MSLPILDAAAAHPDRPAFDDGLNQVTYGRLVGKLSQHQRMIASLEPGQHVAWCPKNDFDAFCMFWAILLQNCVACPISHRFPEMRRKAICERLAAVCLPDHVAEKSVVESNHAAESKTDHDPSSPATVILSSGSTGEPKAIGHSMAAHIASAQGSATNIALSPGDRWLWSLPLFHVSGLSILIRCAVAGATVVGVRDDSQFSADLIDELEITHLSAVNTQLRRLVQEQNFPSKHLKAILLGGSSVDEVLVDSVRQRGVAVHTTYGLTEMASQVTTSTVDGNPARSGSVLPGREVKIAAGGEMLVRGDTLCLGYFTDGEFQPIVDEQGWFHTGDLGAFDETGELTVVGRIDNMFISGGENIYPENIERAITNLFEVRQAVVAPRGDETFGVRPVAFVDGTLPVDWETKLRQTLQSYEVPVEILPWPQDMEAGIKPDRKRMQRLVE